jgi:para-nitrobenzyl esterase
MATPHTTFLRTLVGPISGLEDAGVRVFRGIPYARPPLGAARFDPPVPALKWVTQLDCTRVAAIAPQGPSRLKAIIGDSAGRQSEDCLSLTVWAPTQFAEPLPVMVWVHGGAYVSGGGSIDCYTADALVRNGQVIVVAPNFRLGALGFLLLPGVSAGNLGLLDLVLALKWISDNIAAFGGDPSKVTLFGQSSGATLVRALMCMPAADGLFQHAILQSAALGRPDREPAQAAEIGARFADELGLAPDDRAGFVQTSVAELLSAQIRLARSFDVALGTSELPFTPVIDGQVLLPDASGNWFTGQPGRALMVGYTAQEMSAFHAIDPALTDLGVEQVRQSLRRSAGDAGENAYRQWVQAHPEGNPAALLRDFYTERFFGAPSRAYARSKAERGVPCWVYRFDWPSPSGLGASHCIELPFVFGNLPRWDGAQMVAGADPTAFALLSDKVQRAWVAFARHGSPAHERLPHWPALGARQDMMIFDTEPGICPLPK